MRMKRSHWELIKKSLVKSFVEQADIIHSVGRNIPVKDARVYNSTVVVRVGLETVDNKLLIRPRAEYVDLSFDTGQAITLAIDPIKVLITKQVRDFLVDVYRYREKVDKQFSVYFYVELDEKAIESKTVVLSLKNKIEIMQHYDWSK